VQLQGPGVAGLSQALQGPGVAEQVGVNPFGDPGPGRGLLDDLPGPLAVDGEQAVIQAQLLVKGKALEAMG